MGASFTLPSIGVKSHTVDMSEEVNCLRFFCQCKDIKILVL